MKPCTYCQKKQAVEAYKPFCSKRCADLDLGQWLTGGYAIPTHEPAPSSHENPEESDPYRPANDYE